MVDKHSLGGVPGSRISLIVVPIVAAHGLLMPKTSSRAITSASGTADVMEAICHVDLDAAALQRVVREAGGCIAWNGRLNHSALDDVVNAITRPLGLDSNRWSVASILSKKWTAGSTHVVVDMPYGASTKLPTRADAEALGRVFTQVGAGLGLTVRALPSDGATAIGRGIGPALELRDVLLVLDNDPGAPADLRAKALRFAAEILAFDPAIGDPAGGLRRAEGLLASGAARERFARIVAAQGATGQVLPAQLTHVVHAGSPGCVTAIDGWQVAGVARQAGAPARQVRRDRPGRRRGRPCHGRHAALHHPRHRRRRVGGRGRPRHRGQRRAHSTGAHAMSRLTRLFLTLCLAIAATAHAEEITVTQWGASLYGAPFAVALERGDFKTAGVDITAISGSAGGGTSVRNILASDTPYGEVATAAALAAARQGLDVVIVNAATRTVAESTLVTMPGSAIHGLADLVGKKVAITSPKSTSEMVFLMELQEAGIDASGIQRVYSGGYTQGLTMLEQGAVSAAVLIEPLSIVRRDRYRTVVRAKGLLPAMTTSVGITTRAYAKAHGDVLRAIIAGRRQGVQAIYADPDAAAKLVAKQFGMDPALAQVAMGNMIGPRMWSEGGFDQVELDRIGAGLKLVGEITVLPDWAALIDREFLPADLRQ